MEYFDIDGFCDLNITYLPDDKLIDRIVEFNYRTIALNYTLDVRNISSKSAVKKKKGESTDPSNLIIFPTELARSFNKLISKSFSKLRIFLRITIIFGAPEQLKLVLSSPNIKKYDLIAVLPTTPLAYQHACCNHSIDLITFQIGVSDFKPNGKMHKQLVNRSGYFEISYSQALKSTLKRQETFTMAQYFYIYGKSKNAIISSGAVNYLDVRNPFDVANLGTLFGLSDEKAKCAVSRNCRLLLLASAGRKYGKTAITVELITEEGEQPNRKRIKLNTNDKLSEVTSSISYLSTTEQK